MLLNDLPLWLVLCGTIAMVLAASELGFILGVRRTRQAKSESEVQVSSLTAAHLGLLAFIMAFSFSMAAGHADKRKGLVLEEAIVIEDAYLKAGLLATSEGAEIQNVLRDYTRLRATIGETDDVPALIRESKETLTLLWSGISVLSAQDQFGELEHLVVESVSNVIAINERRVAAGVRTRVPFVIWLSLYLLLVLSMLGMGYFSGIKGQRSPIANTALSISFSVVMFLIADLDRPREGLVKPDQSLIKELSLRMGNIQN
ncbi:MAG: hypothetical protein V7711_16155 [Pseudomonadales bacterium]